MPYILLLCFLATPLVAEAEVRITELMYDLPGSDTGSATTEWIEIYNEGSESVDVSALKLFEADTNHSLTVVAGDAVLSSGAYAIIAHDTTAFLSAYASYSGALFDSSFSLSNEGETIALKSGDEIIESATYSSAMGGAGDGLSLNRVGNSFVARTPSPGESPSSNAISTQTSDDTQQKNALSSATSGSSKVSGKSTRNALTQHEDFTLETGGDRAVVVGAAEFFEARAYAKDKTPLSRVSFEWNFGDGAVWVGEKVLHQYDYPGLYVVEVEATASNKVTHRARFKVTAEPAKLFISAVTPDAVTVQNKGSRELNLSLWSLSGGDKHFLFPKNTVVLPGASVTFTNRVTGISTSDSTSVALIYPNGEIAARYERNLPKLAPSTSRVVEQKEPEPSTPLRADEAQPAEANLAAVSQGNLGNSSQSSAIWIIMLMFLIGIALAGILIVYRKSAPAEETFVIVEEHQKEIAKPTDKAT